jgi:hypothetical protein
LQPNITLENKKVAKLCKHIFGTPSPASMINFQAVAHYLEHVPDKLRLGSLVVEDKSAFLSVGQPSQLVRDRTIDLGELPFILNAMMRDGVSFINTHYDLSDEKSFLEGLPARYSTRHVNSPYDEAEKWKGVVLCVAHILLGDFDFVDRYRGDEFATIFPKRISDLDKIRDALPGLKRRYSETGSVV